MKKITTLLVLISMCFSAIFTSTKAMGDIQMGEIDQQIEYQNTLAEALYWIDNGSSQYALVKKDGWVDVSQDIVTRFSSQIENVNLLPIIDYMNANGIAVVKYKSNIIPNACIGEGCDTAGSRYATTTATYPYTISYLTQNVSITGEVTFRAKYYVQSSGAFISWDSTASSLTTDRFPKYQYEKLETRSESYDFSSSRASVTFDLVSTVSVDYTQVSKRTIGIYTIYLNP